MLKTTTVRLDEGVLKKLEKKAEERYMDRSTYVRQLIMKGYEDEIFQENLQKYKQGKISLGQFSKNTNKSIYELLEMFRLSRSNINVDMEDVEGSYNL